MNDLISRQAAFDVVKRLVGNSELSRTVQVGLHILPSAQPERKTGYWIKVAGMNERCSSCNHYFPLSYFIGRPFEINYCPNCGAKMEVTQNE